MTNSSIKIINNVNTRIGHGTGNMTNSSIKIINNVTPLKKYTYRFTNQGTDRHENLQHTL